MSPVDIDHLYRQEATRVSYAELIKLARWMNRFFGSYPVIVGGWAVYIHFPHGYGSRDIDVVFPNRKIRERVIKEYLEVNHYETKVWQGQFERYVKKVGNDIELIMDTIDATSPNTILGTETEVSWSLSFNHSIEVTIEDVTVLVPVPELLLIYKSKAFHDRGVRSREKPDNEYLLQKREKDLHDIACLCSLKLDTKRILELVDKIGSLDVSSVLTDSIAALGARNDIIDRYGVKISALKNISSVISRVF